MSRKEIDKVIERLKEKSSIYNKMAIAYDYGDFYLGVSLGLKMAMQTLKKHNNVKKRKLI